jgi:hypothetical protein
MGDWKADETAEIEYRTAYLWIVPARVGGNWAFRDAGGVQFNIAMTQNFQELTGEVTQAGKKQPLVGASLRGSDLRFAFNDDKGVTRTFTGSLKGKDIVGVLRAAGGAEVTVTGTLQGQPAAAAWADMLTQCGRFYGK